MFISFSIGGIMALHFKNLGKFYILLCFAFIYFIHKFNSIEARDSSLYHVLLAAAPIIIVFFAIQKQQFLNNLKDDSFLLKFKSIRNLKCFINEALNIHSTIKPLYIIGGLAMFFVII